MWSSRYCCMLELEEPWMRPCTLYTLERSSLVRDGGDGFSSSWMCLWYSARESSTALTEAETVAEVVGTGETQTCRWR